LLLYYLINNNIKNISKLKNDLTIHMLMERMWRM